ncbi:hypothetical protein U8527_07885 [Kordia algicida OT-1]|uniref:Uncharacterized protein n=1 Tax=Kordia algicida OT-1 TaxID=391587 RepID=A9E8W2_9FLAO|nr:hypothetical protein [Kordia algicida]EDP94823.1 hypothetical protein KAOT1_01315 [Kordia algicida OT-1]
MKKLIICTLLCYSFLSFAQETITNKAEMCQILIQMVESDQLYRNGEILKSGKFGRKSTYPKKVIDSVWVLQRKLDDSNTEKLLKLTKKYGWLSDERVNCPKLNIWLLFRHSDKKYYKEILQVIEKEYNAKRLNDFQYKLIKDHVTGKY